MDDMKKSAYRHFMQWLDWEINEDHMSALVRNLFSYETLKMKLDWELWEYMKGILLWLTAKDE